jgi:hypothetical protein
MPNFVRTTRLFFPWLAVLAALQLFLVPSPCRAQGFGSSKKKIVLHRKLPATAHLAGNTFTVQVTSHGMQEDVALDLKSMLETELMKNDARLRAEDKNGDTLIVCSVTQYSQPNPTSSTRSNYEVGSKKPVNETVTRYTGLLTVAYQAKDRRNGRTLDSENVTAKYDDEFDQNGSTKGGVTSAFTNTFKRLKNGKSEADTPPTPADLRNKMLHDVVAQIAARLVNTDEPVEVLLARGKMDEADKLAEEGLWSRYLETLETMTPFASKDDDAYRVYNIGVAYEALAYAAEDPKVAKKDLENAAINYGKAIDDKPSEKYFLTPQTRIETAIAHYRRLSEPPARVSAGASASATTDSSRTTSVKGGGTSSAGKSGTPAKSTTARSAPSKGPALTNEQVIAMVKAKMDEENIIDTIRTAPNVNFDLSVNGQINLANYGVKGKILTAMKQRARAGSH